MCKLADDLPRDEFESIFGAGLDDFLSLCGIEYGDPEHDWCAQAARELRDEAAVD